MHTKAPTSWNPSARMISAIALFFSLSILSLSTSACRQPTALSDDSEGGSAASNSSEDQQSGDDAETETDSDAKTNPDDPSYTNDSEYRPDAPDPVQRLGDVVAIDASDAVIVEEAWSRSTPEGLNGAIYFDLLNRTMEDDRLVEVLTAVAGTAEIHETTRDGDMMRMNHLPDGIEVPARDIVSFAPGGLHIMLLQLVEPLEEGKSFEIELRFEKAEPVKVEVEVRGL